VFEAVVRHASISVIELPVSGANQTVREVVFWSGIGAGVLGGAIGTLALVRSNEPDTRCFRGSPNCTEGQVFASTGSEWGGGIEGPANPPGLLPGPLGLSLMLTGATWSLGTKMIGDDDDLPWLQISAGIVAGALAYGVCAALGAPSG
jgi:hypothetical protein